MARLGDRLELSRCPHCEVPVPILTRIWTYESDQTDRREHRQHRYWAIFCCSACQGLLLGSSSEGPDGAVDELHPVPAEPPPELPAAAQQAVRDALVRRGQPMQALSLLGRALVELLHQAGYTEGSMMVRLKRAAADHRIPTDLVAWADELHIDRIAAAASVTIEDFERHLDFIVTLGDYLFVLPTRIQRCRQLLREDLPVRRPSMFRASWRFQSPRTGEFDSL